MEFKVCMYALGMSQFVLTTVENKICSSVPPWKIWGKKLHDMAFGNDFLDMTPKTQATKGKIDKVNSSKF